MKQFSINNVPEPMMSVIDEFPEIFLNLQDQVIEIGAQRGDDPETLVNLRFGFEFNDGWKEVVRGFCADMMQLQKDAEANGHEVKYRAFIMKEKFGVFTPQGDLLGEDARLYWNNYNEIIKKWARKSLNVCEITGQEGELAVKQEGVEKSIV